MKILLLGGNGFIGRNLREYFTRYQDVYSIDAPSSEELNILDENAVEACLHGKRYDMVIHAAVYNPRIDPRKDANRELESDLRMFYNFHRHSTLFGKMLYFGSGAEFDKRKPICSIKETDAGNGVPVNDYGLAKYIVNQAIRKSDNIINLRVFGLFGKYENWKAAFISGACCKALKGLPITLRRNVVFDYLYIDDFCRLVQWFVDHEERYKDYNLTSGKRMEIAAIAETVKRVSGRAVPVYVCEAGLANEYTADNGRMLAEVGNFVFTPMEEAVKNLYLWYDEHAEEIDTMSLLYQ